MPKKVRLLSVVVILILLLSTLSLGEAFAGGGSGVYDLNNYPTNGEDGSSGAANTISFSIGPGGSYYNTRTLSSAYPGDGDVYDVTVTADTYIRIFISAVADGDWVCWGAPAVKYECAALSAHVTIVGTRSPARLYHFHVWFSSATFPATYTISVTGSNPLSQGRPGMSSHVRPSMSGKVQ